MDINRVQKTGLTPPENTKKTDKPKDTEFQRELGRDVLGAAGDARNVLIGQINIRPQIQRTTEQIKAEWQNKLTQNADKYSLSTQTIADIINNVNEYNEEYLQQLLDSDIYPNDRIADAISGADENSKPIFESRIKMLKRWESDANIGTTFIVEGINSTNPLSEKLIERMLTDGIIGLDDIHNIKIDSSNTDESDMETILDVYEKTKDNLKMLSIYARTTLFNDVKKKYAPLINVILNDGNINIEDLWRIFPDGRGKIDTEENINEKIEIYNLIKDLEMSSSQKGHTIGAAGSSLNSTNFIRDLIADENIDKKTMSCIFYSEDNEETINSKIEMYNFLKSYTDIQPEDRVSILCVAGYSKKSNDFIKQIMADGELGYENIINAVSRLDKEEITDGKLEIYNLLKSNKELKPNEKAKIIYSIRYPEYVDIIKRILANEKFPHNKIPDIFRYANEDERTDNIKSLYDTLMSENKDIDYNLLAFLLEGVTTERFSQALDIARNSKEIKLSESEIILLLKANALPVKNLRHFQHIIGNEAYDNLNNNSKIIGARLVKLHGKTDINEIPIEDKKEVLKQLVACNEGMFKIPDEIAEKFPLIPRNQEEYCSLLPAMVKSMGIDITPLKPDQRIEDFNKSMHGLGEALAEISDEEFAGLNITQEYGKDDFIKTVLYKVKDLPRNERQKVYDYFGFELHHNKGNEATGFSIVGYPANLNNGKKLAKITDEKTKAVVEDLRQDVIRFSENNPIHCTNPAVEKLLNEVISVLPEM